MSLIIDPIVGQNYKMENSMQSNEYKLPRAPLTFSASGDKNTIAEEFLDEAIKILSMEAGFVFLTDDKEENFTLAVRNGFSRKIASSLSVLSQKELIRRGLLPDPCPRWYRLNIGEGLELPSAELMIEEGFKGVGYCTLMISGKVVGIMVLATRRDRNMSDAEMELTSKSANTMALNLFSAKVLERDRQRARSLEEVLEASSELGRADSCEEIAKILASKYTRIARAAYCSVALLADSGRSLQLRALNSVRALEEQKQPGIKFPLDDLPLLRQVLNSGENALIEIHDPHSELNDNERNLLLTGLTKTAMILPLVANNKAVGIVVVGEERRPERNSFNEDTFKMAHILARQAGIAVENVNLIHKVRDEKYFTDLLIQNAAALILVMDEHGRVEITNRALETLTGLKLETTAGMNAFELLFPPETAKRIKELFEITVLKGEPVSFYDDLKNERGQTLLVQWNCAPLRADGKDGMRVVMVGVDNTEALQSRNELEETHHKLLAAHKELKETIEKLQRAYSVMIQQDKLAAVGQLAAGMAHEINNPNAYVLCNLSTLDEYVKDIFGAYDKTRSIALKYAPAEEIRGIEKTEKDLDMNMIRDDCKHLLTESREGAERIAQLVKELRIFSGDKEKDKKLMDIGDIVKNCINVVKSHLKFKATIEMNIPPLAPVLANRALLGQALFNIVINAADFFDEKKSSQNKLKIEAWEEGEQVVVTIEDNGPGIAPENVGRIFEPFFTTKEVGEGTGMGLAVTHDIVKKHDGLIEMNSKLNEGTQFILRFPKASDKSARK